MNIPYRRHDMTQGCEQRHKRERIRTISGAVGNRNGDRKEDSAD